MPGRRFAAFVATALLLALAGAAVGGDDLLVDVRQRAEAGDAQAQFELAARYSRGIGVAADADEAGRWLVRAAEAGHVEARAALGMALLERAENVEERQAAIEWLREAADAGHVTSRFLLGQTALEAGRGEEAVRHFAVLAADGHTEVQVGLALIHVNGEAGVPVNALEAMHWFRQAALQGHPGGQRGLGALLANGDAGPVDLEAGYFWFTLAAARDAGVARYLEDLAPLLDAEQREALEVMAGRWAPGERGPEPVSAAGHLDIAMLLRRNLPPDAEDGPLPMREERWDFLAAHAVHRAPGHHAYPGETIELLLLTEPPPSRALWRWLREGGPPPQPRSLTLFLDTQGRLLHGFVRMAEGIVEVAESGLESDLKLHHGWLGGGLRVAPGEAGGRLDVPQLRLLVEVRRGGS
ncbi:MAG TPA: tetratricopeptide repeat protein [Xanthomonadaceae bacterium]|nr:tetratricopeptide repeat protein [Xanthomonadaceae bacterium]